MASNYQRSKSITSIDFTPGDDARLLARRLLEESPETGHRTILAQALCDALCDAAEINIIRRVHISDVPQVHRKKNNRTVFKQYGYYQPDKQSLSINNRTAVRGQLLAAKTFLDTLLHEWMHHYDAVKLELDSIHTSGFYARIRSLAQVLMDK
jgi:hypothetical protein